MSNFPTPADDAATYPHLIVRVYAAVYQRERINVSAGPWPLAQIAHQGSLVIHPDPFNADGTLNTACRAFLTQAVQHAVGRLKFQMCVVWGPAECTYVEADSITESSELPSGGIDPQDHLPAGAVLILSLSAATGGVVLPSATVH